MHLMPYRSCPVVVGSLLAAAFALQVRACAAEDPERHGALQPRPTALAPGAARVFPAHAAGFADVQSGTAQGAFVEFAYDSTVTGTRRKASVYLPAGYSAQRRYPVLYLLHGIAGNQDEWRGYVRAGAILDNAIAAGQVVPMIVVMPNGRAMPDDRPPPAERMFTPEHVAAFAQFERELLETLVPAIDRAYPTMPEPAQRAVAGLSMGGGQALNYGLGHLDVFSWVGGFSPAPNTRPAANLLPESPEARRRLRLLYLSCGSQDGLIGLAQELHRGLEQDKVPHLWHVDGSGHDRESWAENLYNFTRLLFRQGPAQKN
jgi:enterochelin esterase-like enzyme